ncbi:hypothetical protein BV20DRAFT_459055 [Pilatotrama ljubarskyi]|nr:hypothetical protein BV20DRAFT_459055 [Pilatotrama ljubarskyi]
MLTLRASSSTTNHTLSSREASHAEPQPSNPCLTPYQPPTPFGSHAHSPTTEHRWRRSCTREEAMAIHEDAIRERNEVATSPAVRLGGRPSPSGDPSHSELAPSASHSNSISGISSPRRASQQPQPLPALNAPDVPNTPFIHHDDKENHPPLEGASLAKNIPRQRSSDDLVGIHGRKRRHSATQADSAAGVSMTVAAGHDGPSNHNQAAPKRLRTGNKGRRTQQELQADQRRSSGARTCGLDGGCSWALAGEREGRAHIRSQHYPAQSTSPASSSLSIDSCSNSVPLEHGSDPDSDSDSEADSTADSEVEDETGLADGDRPWRCTHVDCDPPKRFVNRQDLIRHIESAHWGSTFVCEKCGRDFSRRYALVRHRRNTNACQKRNKRRPSKKPQPPGKRKRRK